jgi:hypothetical protein
MKSILWRYPSAFDRVKPGTAARLYGIFYDQHSGLHPPISRAARPKETVAHRLVSELRDDYGSPEHIVLLQRSTHISYFVCQWRYS